MARSRKTSSPRLRRFARRLLVGSAALLALLVAGTFFLTPDCRDEGCPTLANVEEYAPPEPPHVYDHQGRLVGQLPGPQRLVVELEEIPELVKDGFVAVEDRRFRSHGGVDVLGIGRAALANLRSGEVEEGASTITMQLVRNVFEADVLEYNRWRRKLTEARMALALEDRLGKDRILELYLNQIYLGGGVWGVETAARHLFGKSVSEVTTAEAALLVGLAKNPEGYSPRRNPERAKERRSVILDVMVREGLLTPWEADEARDEPFQLNTTANARQAGAYYLAAVDRRVRDLYPDPRARRGLRIHTGYDPALQEAALRSLSDQIEAVERGDYGSYGHPVPGPDGLDEPRTGVSPYLQGMVVALDARNGEVRALVGGRSFAHSEFDRALQARRQPGSAFKPFVYATAFSRGMTLLRKLETGPVTVHQAGQEPWSPADAGDGEPMTPREAMARSSNTAAVRVGQWAGVERVAGTARSLGISTPLPSVPSLFLGSAEVVPAELVAAYAAFGNGGRRVTPHLITRIEDGDGEVLWTPEGVAPEPVLDPGVAYLTLDVLRSVVSDGTGWRVRDEGYHGLAAGKTGTTDGSRDAWFVGMTPGTVAGVWLGFDAPRTIVGDAGGGQLAAPVWGRMMARASRDPRGSGDALFGDRVGWRQPPGVVEVAVDSETGLLATNGCPGEQVVRGLYLEGTQPLSRCPRHDGNFLEDALRGLQKLITGGN